MSSVEVCAESGGRVCGGGLSVGLRSIVAADWCPETFCLAPRHCVHRASQGTADRSPFIEPPSPSPHTLPPLSSHTSTEDTDTPPSDNHRSTLAKSRAPQGSCFPTASPSSGVTVSGPQVTTCPPTCSCPEGEPPLKSHFLAHGDEGNWRCPGRAPVAARPGVASSSLTGITLGALLVKDQRHPD